MSAVVNGTMTPVTLEIRQRLGTGTDLHSKIDSQTSDITTIKGFTDNLPLDTAQVLTDIEGESFATATDSLHALKLRLDTVDETLADIEGASFDTGTDSLHAISVAVGAAQSDITTIKSFTDNLPLDTDQELTDIDTALTTIDGNVDDIETAIGTPAALGGGTASVSGMLESLAGSGFASTDSLKDIKAAIMAVQNNTSFTAVVVPLMEVPESGSADYFTPVNFYDNVGGMEDPDLDTFFMKVLSDAGVSQNSHLFEAAAQTTAATKLTIHTISAPSTAPTAGAVYHDENAVSLTVVGMVGTTKVVFSWSGATAPSTGTLTKDSGTGDSTLTSSAVDNTWVRMLRSASGQYSLFFNVPSGSTKENLIFRFGAFESGSWVAYDRSTNLVDYESTSTIAGATWDIATSGHTTAGTFGKLVIDMAGATFDTDTDSLEAIANALVTVDGVVDGIDTKIGTLTNILGTGNADLAAIFTDLGGATFDTSTDSNEAIRNRLDTLVGTPVTSVSADIAAVKTVVDGIVLQIGTPVDGDISSDIANVQSDITAIKTLTDNLPANTATELSDLSSDIGDLSTTLGSPSPVDGSASTISAMILKIFDDGSGYDATNHSLKVIGDMLAALKTYSTTFAGSKVTSALSQGANAVLEFSTTEGVITNNVTLKQLKVTVSGASTSLTVKIFEKTGTPAGNLIYQVDSIDADGLNLSLYDLIFRNVDNTPTNKVYVQVLNVADAGSSTVTIELRGEINNN